MRSIADADNTICGGWVEQGETDPLEMYLNDVFTVTVNLAGLPGISVPAGLDAKGLPLGLQLIGKAFGEEELLRAAQLKQPAASAPADCGQNHDG